MLSCDTLIRNACVLDGSGAAPEVLDVAIREGRICAIGPLLRYLAASTVDAHGLTLAPGFIDVTHARRHRRHPRSAMLAKISQGVTTVIVGNCGISARAGSAQGRTARSDEPPRSRGKFPVSHIRRVRLRN